MIVGSNSQKQSYLGWNLLYLSKKNVVKQTWKSFNSKFGPQSNYRKDSYQGRQIRTLFCNSVSLILSKNCGKCLWVTKVVKEIKFEEIWGKLKYLRLTLVFTWNIALREKFNFCFEELFASIKKILISLGRLGTSLSNYEV